MITRAGWITLVGVALLLGAGRVLGLPELHVLAGAGLLAVVAALAWVRVLRSPVEVRRSVRPDRVHVGTPARVELDVVGSGPRSSPVLTLDDPIGDRTGAHLKLAPLRPGARTRASYRLTTRQRGRVSVGPLTVTVADPLGLARRTRVMAEQVRLVVLPQVDEIPPLPRRSGSEPLSGQEGRPGPGRSGDDFHALRSYVIGDDLRRVHWPMSARRDELVVRIDEQPRQGRLTIVLDVAEDRSSVEAFERMVSAAASIAAAHRRRGDMVRLLGTDGSDTGWVTGQSSFDGLMEVLAVAAREPSADLARALALVGDGSDGVIAVTGDVADEAAAALPGRRSSGPGRAAALTVVRFRSAPGRAARHRLAGVTVVDIPSDRAFASAWTETVIGRRRRPIARVGAP